MNKTQKELFNKIFVELPNVNTKIKKIEALIDNQNISQKDKIALKETIYGNEIIDTSHEVVDENFESGLLYKSLIKTIENSIEKVQDKKKIAGFLSQSIEIIILDLQQLFSEKESFFEKLSSDYLSDEELVLLQSELKQYFDKMTKVMIESGEI